MVLASTNLSVEDKLKVIERILQKHIHDYPNLLTEAMIELNFLKDLEEIPIVDKEAKGVELKIDRTIKGEK